MSKLLDLAQDVQVSTVTRDVHPSAVHDGAGIRASEPTRLSGAPAESPFGQAFRVGTAPVGVLAKLDPPITEFTPGVVDRYPALAEGPAMQSADRITSLADAEPMDFNTLAAPLAGYRVLYPDRASRLDDRVARRLETRVGALVEQTPFQVAALGRPLEGFAELFPDRSGALRETVALEELARMLAGADVTEKTRSYAQTLLDEATARTLH